MPLFIVGHIDWFEHELVLEKIEAPDWQHAIALHSKWTADNGDVPNLSPEAFKQHCFDLDSMMSWIEV